MTAEPGDLGLACGQRRQSLHARDRIEAASLVGRHTARHRADQLDYLRRWSRGQLAQVVGSERLASDVRVRTLGLPAAAARCLSGLPADQRSLLDAYADGVNAELGAQGLAWTWEPVDSIGVAQYLLDALSFDGTEHRMVEVMRRTLSPELCESLLQCHDLHETALDGSPGTPPHDIGDDDVAALVAAGPSLGDRLVVRESPSAGSNAWAVSGGDGALVGSDVHLPLTDPGLWLHLDLTIGGRRIVGAVFCGLPLPVVGVTDDVAWAFTRLPADIVDVYEVALDEVDVDRPRYRVLPVGPWRDLEVRREAVRVDGGPDVTIVVRDTHLGPVVEPFRDNWLVVDAPVSHDDAIDFVYGELLACVTVDEVLDVANASGMAPVNVLAADRHGRIGWTTGGRLRAGSRSAGGFRSESDQGTGWRSVADLPRLTDPTSGLLVSCNNNGAQLCAWGIGWNAFGGIRARRATHLLSAGDEPESASRKVLLDTDASFYEYYREVIVGAGAAPTELAGRLLEEVLAWRGTSAADEPGLALLVAFREVVREAVFATLLRPCTDYDQGFYFVANAHEAPLRGLLDAVLAERPQGRAFVWSHLLVAAALMGYPDAPSTWGEANHARPALLRTGPRREEPAGSGTPMPGCRESLLVNTGDFGSTLRLIGRPGEVENAYLEIFGPHDGAQPGDDWIGAWLAGPAAVSAR